jgi:hypothetical protein
MILLPPLPRDCGGVEVRRLDILGGIGKPTSISGQATLQIVYNWVKRSQVHRQWASFGTSL